MKSLIEKVEQQLTEVEDVAGEKRSVKYLLAVSAGRDSMVMTDIFAALNRNFGIAHFNFKLRGRASDLDELLVREYCELHQIPFFTQSADTVGYSKEHNISIQEAARELRYHFFQEVADAESYDFICTAHHGNDQLETFFIHLFRGSGLKGLTGIPRIRGRILRPMLWIPGEEIEHYSRKHQVRFREDASNQSNKYLRNRIRHHVIPNFGDQDNLQLKKALETISLLSEYQVYIDNQLILFRNQFIEVWSSEISRISNLIEIFRDPSLRFMLKLYLLDQGLYVHSVNDILIGHGPLSTGGQYEGKGISAWGDRTQLWLIRDSFYTSWDPADELSLKIGENQLLPGGDRLIFENNPSIHQPFGGWEIPIILKEINPPLLVRHRRPGDKIRLGDPKGFHKSIKKLLTEKRIPRPFKDRLYILTDSQEQVISVLGLVNSPQFTSIEKGDLVLRYEHKLDFIL